MMKLSSPTAPLTSTPPSPWKWRLYQVFNFCFGPFIRAYLSSFFDKLEVSGAEHLRGGRKLVLMNHSCPLDPLLISFFGRSHLHFLITEPFMLQGTGSKIASCFGQIPKRKLDFDPTSIRLLKQWADAGANVAIFPEGKFSWDGRPNDLIPGLDQLVSFLDLPVVTVRLINGHGIRPAWARVYRKASVRIEIDPPRVFQKNEPSEGYVRERIFPKIDLTLPEAHGTNLSLGLKKLLRYCPLCSRDDSLEENTDQLKCTSCKEILTVRADNTLTGSGQFTISEVLEKIHRIVEEKISKGELIRSLGQVSLIDITKKDWVPLTQGTLSYQLGKLVLGDWSLQTQEIKDHTIDWGELIIIKTRLNRFAVQLPDDSRAIWSQILTLAKGQAHV